MLEDEQETKVKKETELSPDYGGDTTSEGDAEETRTAKRARTAEKYSAEEEKDALVLRSYTEAHSSLNAGLTEEKEDEGTGDDPDDGSALFDNWSELLAASHLSTQKMFGACLGRLPWQLRRWSGLKECRRHSSTTCRKSTTRDWQTSSRRWKVV